VSESREEKHENAGDRERPNISTALPILQRTASFLALAFLGSLDTCDIIDFRSEDVRGYGVVTRDLSLVRLVAGAFVLGSSNPISR
jgi:hypothetical protein